MSDAIEIYRKASTGFTNDETLQKIEASRKRLENPYYRVSINDDENEIVNQLSLNAPDRDPVAESYRIANAKQFAALNHIPFSQAYANLDLFNEEWLGKKLDPKSSFEAVADSLQLGALIVEHGKLSKQWENSGGTDKEIEAQLDELSGQMEKLSDQAPRPWYVEAIKAGANALPFMASSIITGAGYAAAGAGLTALTIGSGGLAAGVIAPAVYGGLFQFGSFLDSKDTLEGMQYYDLRKQGVSHDVAAPLSALSGGIQGFLEIALGNMAAVGAKAFAPESVKTLTEKITSNVMKKFAVSGKLGAAGKWIVEQGGQAIEEGSEEGFQQLTQIATTTIAKVLEENTTIKDREASDIAQEVWDNAKGGFLASLVIGPVTGAPALIRNVAEAKQVKEAVSTLPKGMAIDEIMKSEAIQSVPEADRRKAAEALYTQAKTKLTAEEERDLAKTPTDEMIGKAAPEGTLPNVHTAEISEGEAFRIYTSNEKTGKPKASVDYSLDDDGTITIEQVNKLKGADLKDLSNLIVEIGRQNPGSEIAFNAETAGQKALVEAISSNNPRGPSAGLQYFESAEDVGDYTTIGDLKQRILQKVPSLKTAKDLDATTFVLDRFARSIPGMDTEKFINAAFVPGVISDEELATKDVAQGRVAGAKFVKLGDTVKTAVLLSKKANGSSVIHELGHGYINYLVQNKHIPEVKSVLDEIEKVFGVESGDWDAESKGWTEEFSGSNRSHWENFTYAMEDYAMTGKVPKPELKPIFDRILEWLSDIYRKIIRRTKPSEAVEKYFNDLFSGNLDKPSPAAEAMKRVEEKAKPKEDPEIEQARRQAEELEKEQSKTVPGGPLESSKPIVGSIEDPDTGTTIQFVEKHGSISPDVNGTTAIKGYEIAEIPLERIKLSKDVPNFKEGAKENGVVEPLNAIKYERLGTAPIILWERTNGDLEVITGRHRLDLARRTGEKTIPAQIVREKEGFSQAQAMTFDAEANIRDGQGSIKDYANYFRNTNVTKEQASSRGLLARDKGRKGFAIGKFASDALYTLYRNDGIGEGKAAAIAEAGAGDPAAQDLGIKKAKDLSAQELSDYIRIVRAMQPETSVRQMDMFGNDDTALLEAEKIAKAASGKQAELRTEFLALNAALKLGTKNRKAIVEKYGVKSGDEKAIRKRIEQLAVEIEEWQNWTTDSEKYKELRERAGLKNKEGAIEKEAPAFKDTETMTLFQGIKRKRENYNKAISKELKPKQPVNSLDEVYKLVQEAYPDFESYVKDFAEKFGGTVKSRPKNSEGTFLKEKSRASRKITSDDGPETILDISGFTINFPNLEKIFIAADELFEREEALRIKDRINKPNDDGYRDLLLNVRMKNGAIMELQLNTNQVQEAKDILGHIIYEITEAFDKGIKGGEIEPEIGNTVMANMTEISKNLYRLAAEAADADVAFNTSSFDNLQAFDWISAQLTESGQGLRLLSDKTKNKLADFGSRATILSSQSKNSSPSKLLSIVSSSLNISLNEKINKEEDPGSGLNSFEKNNIFYKETDPNNPSILYQTTNDPEIIKIAQDSYNNGIIPEGWYVHGNNRSKTELYNDGHVIQMTKEWDVAKQYGRGKGGSIWMIKPGDDAEIFDSTNKKNRDEIGREFIKDYQNGNLPPNLEYYIHLILQYEKEGNLIEKPIESITQDDIDTLTKDLNPPNIVTSAGWWDNPELVNWFTDKHPEIDFIVTDDGAATWDVANNIAVKINDESARKNKALYQSVPQNEAILYQDVDDPAVTSLRELARSFSSAEDFAEELEKGIRDLPEQAKDIEPGERAAWYRNFWSETMAKDSKDGDLALIPRLEKGENAGLHEFLLAIWDSLVNRRTLELEKAQPESEEEANYFNEVIKKAGKIETLVAPSIKRAAVNLGSKQKVPGEHLTRVIYGTIKKNAAAYTRLYGEIMGVPEMVKAGTEQLETEFGNIEAVKGKGLSISEKTAIAGTLKREDLVEKVMTGRITEEDLAPYLEALKTEVKELRGQAKTLEGELSEGSRVMGNQEKKILEQKDTLDKLDTRRKFVETRINKLLEKGKAIPQDLATEKKQVLAAYETAARSYKRIRSKFKDSAQLLEHESKLEAATRIKIKERERQVVRRSLRRIKEHREWLISSIMKPPARNVNVTEAEAVRNIQNMVKENLENNRKLRSGIKKKIDELMKNPGLASAMKKENLRFLYEKQPKGIELVELENLKNQIDQLIKKGKEEYSIKERIRKIRDSHNIGAIVARAMSAKNYATAPAAGSEEAKKRQGGFLKRTLRAADYAFTQRQQFAKMLDNGKESINYELLVKRENEALRGKLENTERRKSEIMKVFKEKGLRIDAWYNTPVVIEKAGPGNATVTLRKSDLAALSIALKDEDSGKAALYGNFFSQDERDSMTQRMMERSGDLRLQEIKKAIKENLTENDIEVLTAIEKDWNETGDRIGSVVEQMENRIMARVDHYFPIMRADSSQGIDPKDLASDYLSRSGLPGSPKKGFTKSRININPKFQRPIKLDLLTTYMKSVDLQEHYIAYAEYIKETNAAYLTRNAGIVRETIRQAHGEDAVSYLRDLLAEYAKPAEYLNVSGVEKAVRWIRGNLGVAYLGFRPISAIKQLMTSVWPALPYAKGKLLSSAFQCMANPIKFVKEAEEKSTILRNRSMDPIQDVLKKAAEAGDAKLKKGLAGINEKSWILISLADRVSVAVAWNGIYEAELEATDGNEKKALERADELIQRTQPSGRMADLSPAFRNKNEFARAFLQFQSALNVIYNNLRHDLPNAVKEHQYGTAVGILVSYAIAGVCLNAGVKLLKKAFGDDEDKDLENPLAYAFFALTQGTDSIPLVGEYVTKISKGIFTGDMGKTYSDSLYPAFDKVFKGIQYIGKDDWEKATSQFLQGSGMILGMPVYSIREGFEAIKEGSLKALTGGDVN